MRTRSSSAVLAAVIVLAAGPRGAAHQPAGAARSPRNASYTIHARLTPDTHAIAADGRLTWRNITGKPATELRFHLYWNAWRDARSTWMRERRLAGGTPLWTRPVADYGVIDVRTLAVNGLNLPMNWISPDDGNRDDYTVLAVPLPQPIPPGGTATVDMSWTAHVPRTFARTGVIGNYYFIGQWFPKIGVFQDDGTWNCHQFHAATEFFADFGTYDVSLTVPQAWVVGATGREVERRDDPTAGTATHRFVQDDVHDFAWTTSPDFIDQHAQLDAPGLPQVDIRLLLQPEHANQAARHFEATRIALTDYGTWFGAYPYDHITVVDPVTIFNSEAQGESTGGMEYPTLFTAGTRRVAPGRVPVPESVTIHEAGHQFWYGVVATNEFEDAWMDEGFNTYSQSRAIADSSPGRFVAVERYFGGLIPWSYEDDPWIRIIDGDRLNQYRPLATADVQSTPTWRYWPPSASAITYNKTALWLDTLERYLGWPVVQRIMATHYARGTFTHPTPDQFFAIANEVSGRDLTWFFDGVYRSSAVFDYGVAQVSTTPVPARADRAGGFETVAVVRRYGGGIFPIDVKTTFEDGTSVRETWDGRDRWHAFTYNRPARVRTVEVDPDRVLLLDVNYTNNSWTSQPHAADAAHKLSFRWLTWLEELLVTYAGVV